VALLQAPKEGPQLQQWAESPQQPKQETIQGEKQHLKTQQEKLIPEVRNVEPLKYYLRRKICKFEAGLLKHHFNQWKSITTDIEVIQTITGLPIPITELPQTPYKSYPVDLKRKQFIDEEIKTLLKKGVIKTSCHEPGEYFSPIFVTEKPDGGFRLILSI